MAKTTWIKKRSQMDRQQVRECHGGEGTLDCTVVLDSKEAKDSPLEFVHDGILRPGVWIGEHRHDQGQEYYYIVSGRGIMTLDGERFEVEAGDLTAVLPGGSHGLANNSDEDLRMIAIRV